MERLMRVSAHVGADLRQEQALLVAPLEQEDDGTLTADAVATLEAREAELVGARDYRSAAMVKDLLDGLGPRDAPLTLADCSPPTVESQIRFFLDNG